MNRHWMAQVAENPSRGITIVAEGTYGVGKQEKLVCSVRRHFAHWPWNGSRCESNIFTSERRVGHGRFRFLRESVDFSYFEAKRYLEVFTPELIQLVNEQLDASVMRELGYEYES
jgi:hypothetical protein